jgi:heterodisulfide reductase subunit A
MQDIGSVLVQASAAAAAASRSLHAAGGGLALVKAPAEIPDSRRREPVRILAAVCRCESGAQGGTPVAPAAGAALLSDPEIVAVEPVVGLCADRGWEALGGRAAALGANRLLIGACLPHRLGNRLRELAAELGLEPSWAQAVDIGAWSFSPAAELPAEALARLKADAARLKHLNPDPPAEVGITPRVLVVGGGIAGMSAALAVADHGIAIDLVEAGERLGGNLNWLRTTLEGYDVAALLENCRRRVEAHARIRVHLAARIAQAAGELGAFRTVVEGPGGEVRVVEHGAVILATGGREAATRAHGWGRSPVVLTQSALEERLAGGGADGAGPGTVVMIQCVDSRREPRNYCSRICCRTALKHALAVKARWPETDVFVLHRDVMAYGFSEEAFTRTRRAGVFYIPYSVERPPRVDPGPEAATVTVEDPVIGRRFAIEAGLVVLATGIVPRLPREIAEAYGARLDPDGFFEEADPKWRPVEGLKEGVFACGTALAPGGVAESVASAEAAAARAVVLLSRGRLRAARSVARVRRSLCSLCGQCIGACPFEARTLDLERGEVRVHPILCQGCGACAAACPNAAAVLEGFAPQQVFAEIDAVLGR